MKPKLGTYLFLIGHTAAGLILLILIQKLQVTANTKTCIAFVSFLLLNLLYVKVFRLKEALYAYWSLRKLPYLAIGAFAGLILIIIPIAAAIVTGKLSANTLHIGKVSITSVFITFLITGWEELWFRNLLLNYSSKFLSKITISLMMGFLFMILHLLNPEISIWKEGPLLFLAGTLLTILYFYYRNIWLPAGLHFGNNFSGSFINTSLKDHPVFGNEGYIYILLLLSATLVFLVKLKRSESQISS